MGLIAEGKTKRIWEHGDPGLVVIESKDDLTAGDGARHNVIPAKGWLANRTTANVFGLLRRRGVPTAFRHSWSGQEFVAERCTMIPYEVVARRRGIGSYLKRNPGHDPRQRFNTPLIEFYLKTSDKQWQGHPLTKDDPYVVFDGSAKLYRADQPIAQQTPMLELVDFPLADRRTDFLKIVDLTDRVFLILETVWAQLDCELVDLKLEFGFNEAGNLLLADVVDNDSWRLFDAHGNHLDKQLYRNGAPLEQVVEAYRQVAVLTDQFARF